MKVKLSKMLRTALAVLAKKEAFTKWIAQSIGKKVVRELGSWTALLLARIWKCSHLLGIFSR